MKGRAGRASRCRRRRRRALPRVRPGRRVSFRARAQIYAVRREQAALFALRDRLGFARNVIVQATCHGADNSAMVDACLSSERPRARRRHCQARVDGRGAAAPACGGRARRALQLRQAARRLHAEGRIDGDRRPGRKLGWHVVIYFEAVDLPELWDFFTALPTTVVVDHMGRPDVTKPIDGPEFSLFLKFMREHENVWSKVSCPERLSVAGPPALNGEQAAYRDVVPFARRVVEEFPDRVLWGTDWPHPNLKGHMPDDGLAGRFHSPYRADGRTAAKAARRQSDAALLARRSESLTWRSTNPISTCPARRSSTRNNPARAIGSTSSACR